jgi:hypothetical protein
MRLYQKYRPYMRTGDCVLWSSASVVGWLIRKIGGAPVNHASLVLRFEEYRGFTDRLFHLEALARGIEFNLLSSRLRGHKGYALWLPLKPKFDHLRPRIGAWALEQVGTPYDYGSLFKQAVSRVSAEASKLFCSEYCYLAWKNAGIDMQSVKHAPRPWDIPDLDIFHGEVGIK